MKIKLNVLLAVTDTLRTKYKNMVADYSRFFAKSQGAFQGVKNTYVAKDGMIDDPSKRGYQKIQTTVDEKLNYFLIEAKEFINCLFSQERTNALGLAKAELIVDEGSWGEFTSLELLRLKSLLESGDLGDIKGMFEKIPVRSDSVIWNKTESEEYEGRNIWENERVENVARTTEKESYILKDPNVAAGNIDNYVPQVAVKTKSIDIGDYTHQFFSRLLFLIQSFFNFQPEFLLSFPVLLRLPFLKVSCRFFVTVMTIKHDVFAIRC